MIPVKTKDGSITFFNERYQEHYHSVSGAREEAIEKFVKPCRIADGFNILDICFGMGYNTCAALDAASNLKIVALENDVGILKSIIKIPGEDFTNFGVIKALTKGLGIGPAPKTLGYEDDKYEITLIIGDAQKTIKSINGIRFNAVFLDPFSPKKCPELWSKEFFTSIFDLMYDGGILATYSCSRSVRRNLQEAGFRVEDGPCVGRRSPSTVAYKQ